MWAGGGRKRDTEGGLRRGVCARAQCKFPQEAHPVTGGRGEEGVWGGEE